MKRYFVVAVMSFVFFASWLFLARLSPGMATPDARVGEDVWAALSTNAQADVLIQLAQPDLSHAYELPDKEARGRWVYETLSAAAREAQAPIVAELARAGVDYRQFWAVNMVQVQVDEALLRRLLRYPQIQRVVFNAPIRGVAPDETPISAQAILTSTTPWGLERVEAPQVWAEGITGEGVVIAGQDTGYDWSHGALKTSYRGFNAVTQTVSHAFNWHDAIHEEDPSSPATNPCGIDLQAPCDDYGHGTHTMGTMIGNDLAPGATGWPAAAAHPIGAAPGAKWIGCRNMESGIGHPSTYIECYQWSIAPWGGNDPFNGDPTKAPDIINNSWACTQSEGCTPDVLGIIEPVIKAVDAAGILNVVSAGNSGPRCNSIKEPPAIYQQPLTVGATDPNDHLASFSSRGPVQYNGQVFTGPDLTAPGVGVLSAFPENRYTNMSGTSMAGPHASAVAALLLSAEPSLKGKPAMTRAILTRAAEAITDTASLECGGEPGGVPNNSFGWGIANAADAIDTLAEPANIIASLEDRYGRKIEEAGRVFILREYPSGRQVATATTDSHGQVHFTTTWGSYTVDASTSAMVNISAPIYAVGGLTTDAVAKPLSRRSFLPLTLK
jgi:subtilisin family serine protease